MGSCQDERDGAEVGILDGSGGPVSGEDDVIGEPDGETRGDDGVGWMGQVICIYPYVPLTSSSQGHSCNEFNKVKFNLTFPWGTAWL